MLKAYIRVFHFSGYVLSAMQHVSPLKSICCSCSLVVSSFVLKLILLSFTPFRGIGVFYLESSQSLWLKFLNNVIAIMLHSWVSSLLCMEFSFCFNIVSLSLSLSLCLILSLSVCGNFIREFNFECFGVAIIASSLLERLGRMPFLRMDYSCRSWFL